MRQSLSHLGFCAEVTAALFQNATVGDHLKPTGRTGEEEGKLVRRWKQLIGSVHMFYSLVFTLLLHSSSCPLTLAHVSVIGFTPFHSLTHSAASHGSGCVSHCWHSLYVLVAFYRGGRARCSTGNQHLHDALRPGCCWDKDSCGPLWPKSTRPPSPRGET